MIQEHYPPAITGVMLPAGKPRFESMPYRYRGLGFDSIDRTSPEHPFYHLHTVAECGANHCRKHRSRTDY